MTLFFGIESNTNILEGAQIIRSVVRLPLAINKNNNRIKFLDDLMAKNSWLICLKCVNQLYEKPAQTIFDNM